MTTSPGQEDMTANMLVAALNNLPPLKPPLPELL